MALIGARLSEGEEKEFIQLTKTFGKGEVDGEGFVAEVLKKLGDSLLLIIIN